MNKSKVLLIVIAIFIFYQICASEKYFNYRIEKNNESYIEYIFMQNYPIGEIEKGIIPETYDSIFCNNERMLDISSLIQNDTISKSLMIFLPKIQKERKSKLIKLSNQFNKLNLRNTTYRDRMNSIAISASLFITFTAIRMSKSTILFAPKYLMIFPIMFSFLLLCLNT